MCAIFEGTAGHDFHQCPPPMIAEWGRSIPRDPLSNHSLAVPDSVAGYELFDGSNFGNDSLLDGLCDVGVVPPHDVIDDAFLREQIAIAK
eukprot:3207743-Karenia_brevis.AAC.1